MEDKKNKVQASKKDQAKASRSDERYQKFALPIFFTIFASLTIGPTGFIYYKANPQAVHAQVKSIAKFVPGGNTLIALFENKRNERKG